MKAVEKYAKIFAVMLVAGSVVGCSSTRTRTEVKTEETTLACVDCGQTPGVVQYVWEEPMVDVIDVPPGLDPEGHYYRPAHKSIVEIRQGRWQFYKRPGEEKQ